MRKLLSVAILLVGLGLGLFFLLRSAGPGAPLGAESGTRPVSAKRLGAEPRVESPEDVGVRGSADAGSTPALAQLPSEGDGVLEVEVFVGGQPVPGAGARLYWRGARDPNLGEVSWRLASEGSTNAQGRVRLASRAGRYLVAVRAEGFAPVRREVVRPAGEARTLLRLELEPALALAGRTVVKGSREPLPLVELVLIPHGRKLEPWQEAEAPAEERVYAASDARGRFLVEGLAAGEYQLEASAPGHSRTVLHTVKVPAAEPLTVALLPAGIIEGFVVDAQGRPAAGAEVQLGGFVPQTVTTGQGGGFSVEVEAGEYLVSARRGSEAGALDRPLTVSAGRTVRNVQVRLGSAAVLEGRVVARATQAPVAGARVDVSPYGRSGDSGRTVTDEEGRFSVGALAPGSYDVVVSAPGFSTLARRGLTVASGERFTLELALTGTGAAEGQVRDGKGQPIMGVLVAAGERWSIALGNPAAESRTDSEGRYRLEGLDPGRLFLTARWEGASAGVSLPVEVKEGATASVDFTLEELGTVEGRVRASRGSLPAEPLAVAAIAQGRSSQPPEIGNAEVDAAGTFRLRLPPGGYDMYLSETGRRGAGLQAVQAVHVKAGETVQTELLWQSEGPSAGEIQGLVLEPDGAPSPGAFVTLSVGDSGMIRGGLAITDEQGHFSLSLPPGMGADAEGQLSLSARNGRRQGKLPAVRPGARQVVVKLQPAASVQGRVVREDGQAPVRGFTLSLQPRGPEHLPMEENVWEFPGDRFELREVPAEPLELVARTADGARGEALIGPEPGAVEVVEIFIGPLSAPAGFLGLSVRPEGAQLLLGPLAPSGPAAQAGLREGDVLLAVDGHPVANIMEVEERLDGAPGTTVVLTVRREGSEQSFSVLRAP